MYVVYLFYKEVTQHSRTIRHPQKSFKISSKSEEINGQDKHFPHYRILLWCEYNRVVFCLFHVSQKLLK